MEKATSLEPIYHDLKKPSNKETHSCFPVYHDIDCQPCLKKSNQFYAIGWVHQRIQVKKKKKGEARSVRDHLSDVEA